ncbi:MAG: zinc/iron-chelating domain-containing protein [Isosphaeraceae bacterium]|jgi:Fe-S-cluster containining protein|nr:MAG: zinc/iron-chelating domain-containing protein [Isosphaeraceae bacterium]
MNDPRTPWYRDGLPFACTRCGRCCTGAPGYVWVDLDQIRRLADHLQLPLDEFTTRYVRRVGQRFSLIERPGGDCVFWDRSAGCTVYPARPTQCRSWPFWPKLLASPEAWQEAQSLCPGTRAGPIVPLDTIEFHARRAASVLP